VEDFDAGDGVERDGDVEVEVAGLGVVDAETIDEDEGLLEGGAADGEIGLDSEWGAGLEVKGGVLTEIVDGAGSEERLVASVDGLDGAVGFGERDGRDGGGDGYGLLGWCGGAGLLRDSDRREEEKRREDSSGHRERIAQYE
jgi:hypothetical protein